MNCSPPFLCGCELREVSFVTWWEKALRSAIILKPNEIGFFFRIEKLHVTRGIEKSSVREVYESLDSQITLRRKKLKSNGPNSSLSATKTSSH